MGLEVGGGGGAGSIGVDCFFLGRWLQFFLCQRSGGVQRSEPVLAGCGYALRFDESLEL